MPIIHVNNENFKEVIDENDVVILDFYANWCGPCRMLAQVLEEISETNPDLVIGKINVDEEGELAQAFSIRSIPQLYISKGGKIVKNISGYVASNVILEALEEC
mgnify:FL=1|jgi:thioredoxin 1